MKHLILLILIFLTACGGGVDPTYTDTVEYNGHLYYADNDPLDGLIHSSDCLCLGSGDENTFELSKYK